MNHMNKLPHAAVLYHANCIDGFAAAWAFHVLKSQDYQEVDYHACEYSKPTPPMKLTQETDVYMLDYVLSKPEGIEFMATRVNTITVCDHHKTAIETHASQNYPLNVELHFDINRSGAGIAWDYFSKDYIRPSLIDYVEDRDLWKFVKTHSKAINAFISIHEKTFDSYSQLSGALEYKIEECRLIGEYLNKQHDKICKEIALIARTCLIETEEDKYEGLVCNCSPQFASEVGNILAGQSQTYGATYFTDKDGTTKWSLRSKGDYDVTRIAKAYGGGGHKNAAGFIIPGNSEIDHMVHLWKVSEV